MQLLKNFSLGNILKNKYFFWGNKSISMETDKYSTDWINSFNLSTSSPHFYNENTDFVLLQRRNFALNSAIDKIASKVSNANFTDISQKDTELLKKLSNPNNFQSKQEFLKEFTVYILSCGHAIIWKRYVSFGNLSTLDLINIDPTKATITKDTITFEYEKKQEVLNVSDVIIFYDKTKNNDTFKGYSRVIPLRSHLENISLAQKAKNIQISNSGTTIVSPKQTAAGSNIDEGLNAPVPVMGGGLKTQKDQMQDELNNKNLENRIVVSSKGLDAVNLSEKLSGIDFQKIIEPDLLAVYDAFSIPIELTPFGPNAKFNNKALAELSVLENEVSPLINNLISGLNSEFKRYGQLIADLNHIGAMSVIQSRIQDTNQKTIEQYKTLLDCEVITIAEYRKILIDNKILT